MKAILIAASIVGLAAAGLIIYLQNVSANHDASALPNAMSGENNLMGEGNMERPAHHAMG